MDRLYLGSETKFGEILIIQKNERISVYYSVLDYTEKWSIFCI